MEGQSTFSIDKWETEFCIHNYKGDGKFDELLSLRKRGDGLLCIQDSRTNAAVFMDRDTLKALHEALFEYFEKPVPPATVDGMTALKHIMDGGGAYRIGGNKLFDCVPIRMRERDGQPEFWYKGIDGDWVGQSFTASMITATDWVLVP